MSNQRSYHKPVIHWNIDDFAGYIKDNLDSTSSFVEDEDTKWLEPLRPYLSDIQKVVKNGISLNIYLYGIYEMFSAYLRQNMIKPVPMTEVEKLIARPFTKISKSQYKKFFVNGIPKHIRLYSNRGTDRETMDHLTCVFTGSYMHFKRGNDNYLKVYYSLNSSDNPFSGVGSRNEDKYFIDRPTHSHLGKKVKWETLTEEQKIFVVGDYVDIWNLK